MIYLILISISFFTILFGQHYNLTNSSKQIIENTNITYTKCEDSQKCNFKPFPIEFRPQDQPSNPKIGETFILHIPNGKIYSDDGIIIAQDHIFKELLWQNDMSKKLNLEDVKTQTLPNPVKIKSKVAVITQNGHLCYYHWITEVLGRLLLLESQNAIYDYLIVPLSQPYMKESLKLLNIDLHKVIEPYGQYRYIQADELIVPSLINQVLPTPRLASYPSTSCIQRLRNKFLPIINSIKIINDDNIPKKIFISRKDASRRKLTNEDKLFNKLKLYGFQRYCLSELSILEQIRLFHHADIIIALHGAGLTNLIFSKPETQVIELFQARADATYWYISQILNLKHTCIQTCEFDQQTNHIGFFDTTISEKSINNIIDIIYDQNR